MATVHFLNVWKGDCSIIEHDSGRVSVIDICNGNASSEEVRGKVLAQFPRAKREVRADIVKTARGNFGMNSSPTDPIAYLKGLEVSSVFRFILTHPDMDHLDGFKRLCDEVAIVNFWDSGVWKKKPDFPAGGYEQRDWEQYEKVVDGQTEVHVLKPLQGDQFQYANKGDPNGNGDFLYIVSSGIDVYVENESFAEKFSTFDAARSYNGCFYVRQAGRLEYKDE